MVEAVLAVVEAVLVVVVELLCGDDRLVTAAVSFELVLLTEAATLIVAEIAFPVLSIMLTFADVILPVPDLPANETVAIWPFPEKELVLIIAIFMEPGIEVLAASIAPETSPPWVTVGEFSDAESYVMSSWIPATLFMPIPCTV